MQLYDPFEEIAKNYGRPIESPPVRIISALMPTGRHVGSANSLVHVHNSHGGGGKATSLERYKGHGTKLGRKMAGPIHKGELSKKAGFYASGGLQAIAHQKPPSRIPRTGQTAGKIQRLGIMRTGAERRIGFGTTGDARNADMARLRGQVGKGFGSAFRAGFDPALHGAGNARGVAGKLGGKARRLSDAANAPRARTDSTRFTAYNDARNARLKGPVGKQLVFQDAGSRGRRIA